MEDDETQRLYIERMVTKLGHTVLGTLKNGSHAIKMVKRFDNIDLIIMDINLEGELNGIQTMKEIRKFSNLKLIYTSGYGKDNVKKVAVKTNYSAFLMKPIKPEDLRDAIDESFQDSH